MVTTAAGPGVYPEGSSPEDDYRPTDTDIRSGAWFLNTEEERAEVRRRFAQWELAQRRGVPFDREAGVALGLDVTMETLLGAMSVPQPVVTAATAPATTTPEPQGRPQAPEKPVIRHDGQSPAEKAATKWSERIGLPKHNPNRPSRTREGRRQAYLRDVAERDGISLTEAARLHPPRPRRRTS